MEMVVSNNEAFDQETLTHQGFSITLDPFDSSLDELQHIVDSRKSFLYKPGKSRTRNVLPPLDHKTQVNCIQSQALPTECQTKNAASPLFPVVENSTDKSNVVPQAQSNIRNGSLLSSSPSLTSHGRNLQEEQDLHVAGFDHDVYNGLVDSQTSNKNKLAVQNYPTFSRIANDGCKELGSHNVHTNATEEGSTTLQVGSTWSDSSSPALFPPASAQSNTCNILSASKDDGANPNLAQVSPSSTAIDLPAIHGLIAAETQTEPVAPAIVRRDAYRNPKRITESVFAFPASGSEISLEYWQTFPVIAHELRQNLEKHHAPVLADPRVDIDLFMAGSSKADVRPSIVVTCDTEMVSHIEDVLYQAHIQNHHNLIILRRSKVSWRSSRKWQPPKSYTGNGPCYQLCVRARDIERIELGGKTLLSFAAFDDHVNNPLWCGSKIVQPLTSWYATLSCILSIGGRPFGMTTAHNFRPSVGSVSLLENPYLGFGRRPPLELIIPDFNKSETKLPDLDWTLTSIPNQKNVRSDLSMVRLGLVAPNHPQQERNVLVLSSTYNMPQAGILLCGTTISGAEFDAADIEYWNVELENNDTLRKGDSGSLVIDTLTKDIYGHVVAQNSYGYVQIVPMYTVLPQIQYFMGAAMISIVQDFQSSRSLPYDDTDLEASETDTVMDSLIDEGYSEGLNKPSIDHTSVVCDPPEDKHQEESARKDVLERQHQVIDHPESSNHGQEQLDDIERTLLQTLHTKEVTCGPEDASTLDAVSNLGNYYRIQGKIDEAVRMLTRALQGYNDTIGFKHISTLEAATRLGLLYLQQSMLEQAEEIFVQVLQGYNELLGPKSTPALDTLSRLGLLYLQQDMLDEAGELLTQATQGYNEVFGDMHTSTIDSIDRLGAVYLEKGMLTQAKETCGRVVHGRIQLLGSKHLDTLQAMENSATIHGAQEEYEAAKELYTKVLAGREEQLGSKHPDTIRVMEYLASLESRMPPDLSQPYLKFPICWY